MYAALTETIVGAAIEVHRELGPGLLEAAYEACLAHEFARRGIPFRRQVPVPIIYKGEMVEAGFRLDFVVNDLVIVELKAIEALAPIHQAQLLTHLRLAGKRVGLLISFNVRLLKDGIKRLIL
jgi:GxxExxY protein